MRLLNKSSRHLNLYILLFLFLYPLASIARLTETPKEFQQSKKTNIQNEDENSSDIVEDQIKQIDNMHLNSLLEDNNTWSDKEIGLMVEQVENIDLKMPENLFPQSCPNVTEVPPVEKAPGLHREEKDEEDKNRETESIEVPADRARLYAEITDRLTRIVEKLTAIIDFLNQTFAAIAQKNGITTPSVIAGAAEQSETEKLTSEKEMLDKQNKMDEEKLQELKAREKQLEAEQMAKEEDKRKAEEFAKNAKEAAEKTVTKVGEAATSAEQTTKSAAESALEATRKTIAETEERIEKNQARSTSLANQILSQVITIELEKQSLHNRAKNISDKINEYLQIAGKILDEAEKEDVVELLESAKNKIVDILTVSTGFENLSAEQIDKIKNSLNEVDVEVGSVEKYFKAVKKLEEDSKKKV